MNDYRRLDVWRLAIRLAEDLYQVTRHFPPAERYGLRSQMRRAAVSIPSNIAEGAVRGTNPDFRRFLFIAKGSAAELDTQLQLAQRFGFVTSTDTRSLREEIDRCQAMLTRLIQSLS